MNGRPHESPDCRCDACARYDREQEYPYPYGKWNDGHATFALQTSAYAAERAAWQALVDMYDAVRDFARDNSRDDS